MRARPRYPLGEALAGEQGFAVPTVLLALVAVMGLASATVVASIDAQSGTSRDQKSKAALAAAEAGVSNAVLRYNRIPTAGNPSTACAPVGGASVSASGWCANQVSGGFDRGTYTYAARPTAASGATPAQLKIASTGTVDGVSRRVTALADGYTANFRPFGSLASVIGVDGVTLSAKGKVTGNVATNGNIGLGTGALLTCNSAQVGVGRGFSPNDGTATCGTTQGTVALPPVNPGDVATNNSNWRICNTGTNGADPIAPANKCGTSWNATSKILALQGGAAITLGAPGGEFNYAFCRLELSANSYLYVATGATVRIYLLSPDSAPCTNQANPLVLNAGSKLQPTGAGAADLGILIVGSATKATTATLSADASYFGCDQMIALYAPRTTISLSSKSEICGGVAGKAVSVAADTTIKASNTALDFELPGVPGIAHYDDPRDFVECSAAPPPGSTTPDGGC